MDIAMQQQAFERLEKQLRQKEKELYSIQRIGKALSSTLNLDELLKLIMQEITTLMDADRSTLFIVDREKGEIWSKIALKAEVKEIRQTLGKGISGYVAETGKAINIPDAYQDNRFDPATDKRTGYRTRSILCMPVWNPQSAEESREIIGVIQVLNKHDGIFSEEDEALLESLSAQVAISIANARLYSRLEKKFREIDLLYDFEQMLNSVQELPKMLGRLLVHTLDHLEARWVLGYVPHEGKYFFFATDRQHRIYFESAASVSLGWMNFVQQPTLKTLVADWETFREYFRINGDLELNGQEAIFSPIPVEEDERGLLIALDVGVGKPQHYADEQKMLELVAQKVFRARELQHLRESLLKRERLSAIGQLMSTIVHDIRGPVNTIYGFVDLIEDETTSAGERKEYAGIIREEIQSAMNMITEVLDFAKGKTSILPRKSSVKNLVGRFKPRLQQMCQKNDTELTVSVDSAQLIYADEDKLTRVFYNITKNALEAMETGGRFDFRVNDDGKVVTFHFSDSGPGIPREILDRLFDSFVTSGKESGTGLGLAIVKKIVDEHRGEIEIDSPAGAGATFRIKLPVMKK